MPKPIPMTIKNAVSLWSHLDSMAIDGNIIYTEMHVHRSPDGKAFMFLSQPDYPISALASDICVITLRDYHAEIKALMAKQANLNSKLEQLGLELGDD